MQDMQTIHQQFRMCKLSNSSATTHHQQAIQDNTWTAIQDVQTIHQWQYMISFPFEWLRSCPNPPSHPIDLKEKSKVFKYAKWPSKWLTNESLVWDLMKFKKKKCLCWFLIDFIFCRLAETAVSGSPSVTWLSRKWRQSGESVRLPS